MQKPENLIKVLQTRGAEMKPITRLYRQLYNVELWKIAYAKISKNDGALTPGTDGSSAIST